MVRAVALITGASGGLGKCISKEFINNGYQAVLQYYQNKIFFNESDIHAENRVACFQADLRETGDLNALFDFIKNTYGKLDVLINCAGKTCDALMARMSEHDWDDVIRLNLTAPYLCIQRAIEIIPKESKQTIINVASLSGITGNKGQVNYAASKAGLIALT
ncbi:MAG: SDR family NAD(P)-dependent oxidoreductase, partial [Chlamydiota bacterium]|nr:SDR family NAD(P)-dependent oxidoreductase [Chlamydiota bacterium]